VFAPVAHPSDHEVPHLKGDLVASRRKLDEEEIRGRIGELPGWEILQGKLHREFRFDDFVAAFSFMTSLALVAEKLDHHPEWFNVYNRVVVDLTTHDARGISEKDFEFAAAASKIWGKRPGK
jgi:4a-hydroxytetrahydrobiopterin dehydratase